MTHAIKIQNEKAVAALIKIHADVNQPNKRGITPISAASHKGSLAILEMLIRAGAQVNSVNATGSTALIQVCDLLRISLTYEFLIYLIFDVPLFIRLLISVILMQYKHF